MECPDGPGSEEWGAHAEDEAVRPGNRERFEEVHKRMHERFYDRPCIVHRIALRIERSGDLEE